MLFRDRIRTHLMRQLQVLWKEGGKQLRHVWVPWCCLWIFTWGLSSFRSSNTFVNQEENHPLCTEKHHMWSHWLAVLFSGDVVHHPVGQGTLLRSLLDYSAGREKTGQNGQCEWFDYRIFWCHSRTENCGLREASAVENLTFRSKPSAPPKSKRALPLLTTIHDGQR